MSSTDFRKSKAMETKAHTLRFRKCLKMLFKSVLSIKNIFHKVSRRSSAQKMEFSSVNVTISAVSCGFGHIYLLKKSLMRKFVF